MPRKYKPKVLVLSLQSPRSIMRLALALAMTEKEAPKEYELTRRAEQVIRLLSGIT